MSLRYGVCLLCGVLSLAGCGVGSRALESDYPRYNQTIRDLEDEHMLLNLVRLRYFEAPVFLQISSISTTYGVSVSTDVAGTVGSGNSLTAGAGTGYSETPTITYSLPESREFFGRMLAPLSSEQLAVLSTTGGGTQMLQMGIKKMNRLGNVDMYDEWRSVAPTNKDELDEALQLIAALRAEGLIDFAYAFKTFEASSPFDELADARAIAQGEQIGLEFYQNDEGKWVAYVFASLAHLRFSPASDASPKATRLRELLGLVPDQYSFALIDVDDAVTEKQRIAAQRPAAALDPDASYSEIVLQNRSMMEILWYASHAVQVPPEQLDAGLAPPSENSLSGLLTIRSSLTEPQSAAVKVKYEGYWFYIAANDLRSRATISNLNMLFAVTAGTVPGGKPVLTLPVR